MTEKTLFEHLAPDTSAYADPEEMCLSRDDLTSTLLRLESAVLPEDVPALSDIKDAFEEFAVKVSLIGQVKAGKTALANALLGVSDLLPSDVNPWTSVVTSIHLNQTAPKGKNAIFKFFDAQDWDDLVSSSGRIVQLAKKAKLDSGLDELRDQITELKERTEARLGHNFKMLLGNQHNFSAFNGDLIKRYVCLGDEDSAEDREGRFADLTKSADLYLNNDSFAYPVTIADTPGVNDPFLVREAATLQNLAKSDIYVVVLSAHQALTTVDLGLLRLLKSLHSNRMIVFVNRVDELPDPHNQIIEIDAHVRGVLEKQKIDTNIPIIFGSAAWADAAINGNFDDLPDDSVESLGALISERGLDLDSDATDACNINNLRDVSGLSALRAAIHQKAWDEVFDTEITRTANAARRLAERSLVYISKVNEGPTFVPDPAGIRRALKDLDAFKKRIDTAMQSFEQKAIDALRLDMAQVYTSFIKSEKRALSACLGKSGQTKDWTPETEALRSDLNACYQEYVETAETFARNFNSQTMDVISTAYENALGSAEGIRITPLPIAEPPLPLSLMRTMSIDLRASGSIEWLRRKLDKSIYLEQFEDTVNADFVTIIEDITTAGVQGYLANIAEQFYKLTDEHHHTISGFGQTGKRALEARLKEMLDGDNELAVRLSTLQETTDMLHALEAGLTVRDDEDVDNEDADEDVRLEAAE